MLETTSTIYTWDHPLTTSSVFPNILTPPTPMSPLFCMDISTIFFSIFDSSHHEKGIRYLWTTPCALLRAAQCLGSFNNYEDIILVFFDHLSSISMWIFFTRMVDKHPTYYTTYPPHLVHIVFERPIAGISPTTYWPNSLFLSIQVEETGKHTFQKLLHCQWRRKLPKVGRTSSALGATIYHLWLI